MDNHWEIDLVQHWLTRFITRFDRMVDYDNTASLMYLRELLVRYKVDYQHNYEQIPDAFKNPISHRKTLTLIQSLQILLRPEDE